MLDHPLVLAAALACAVAAAAARRRPRAVRARRGSPCRSRCSSLLINPIVSREGLTVLGGPAVPLFGTLDITLEAIAYGAVAALRVLVVVLAFALFSAAVDPDEMLRILRRVASRSALTASLATRLVPVLAATRSDSARRTACAPARRCRDGRVRSGAVLTRALAAGALERAVDIAAALEVRGYALGTAGRAGAAAVVAPPTSRSRWRRGGGWLLGAGCRGSPASRHSIPTRCCGRTGVSQRRRLLVVLPALPGSVRARGCAGAARAGGRAASRPAARAPQLPLSGAPGRRWTTVVELGGRVVVLAGGSGSGKSTLLRAACGLVPHFYGGSSPVGAVIGPRHARSRGRGNWRTWSLSCSRTPRPRP